MDFHFTVKILGKIEKTQDLAVVERWRESGRLVLVTPAWPSRIWMVKDKVQKEIKSGPEAADICVELWKKGYKFLNYKKKESAEVIKPDFQNILISVANVIEPTNAKKAQYFRNAIPYEIRYREAKLLVVDFPTRGNSLKRCQEKFHREGKPYNITTLYHGTKLRNVPSIVKCGLKRSRSGMLGRGIYLSLLSKARNFSDSIIFETKVILGRCKQLKKVEKMNENGEYDSLHACSGKLDGVYKGWLSNDEWCVRYPEQIEISRLICDIEWNLL
jgi:hypothetical protein